jgi:prevent-host-death family protein
LVSCFIIAINRRIGDISPASPDDTALFHLDEWHKHGHIYGYQQRETELPTYNVADAKNALPRLIDRALQGEEVVIARRGRPVVELKPLGRPPSTHAATYGWLRSRRDARPEVGLSSVEILDRLYEPEDH